MERIFTVTTPNGEHDIDLSTIRDIWAPVNNRRWRIGRGSEYDDIETDATNGAAIRAAWRAYHGTHTPAEPVGVPVFDGPEPLPLGWKWDGVAAVSAGGTSVWVGPDGDIRIGNRDKAPLGVVEIVARTHRARGGA